MNKKYIRYIGVIGILIILVMPPLIMYLPMATVSVSNESSSSSLDSPIIKIPSEQTTSSIVFSPDGKGYLKEIGNNKYLLHVEGSPYEMGYQHGYLCAEGASRMASEEFFVKVVLGFLGFDGDGLLSSIIDVEDIKDTLGWLIPEDWIEQIYIELDQSITDLLLVLVLWIVQKNLKYVPQALIEEMQGLADGATDAGYATSFNNVLLLNMAFDAILSIVYPIITPLLLTLEGLGIFHMCNAFVAHGTATTNGNTIMGRDFMFNGAVFSEVALLIEQDPDDGNKFVSTTAPGFVGVTAAMNEKGIGIGMDMCPSVDCTPADFGMGCLLTARYVVQNADELSEAVNIIKTSKRGVSWIYPIGDGRGSEVGGVALEVSAHHCYPRYSNYKKPWWMPNIYSQIENKVDLVVITNHFIRTEINILSLSYAVEDSRWRYEVLVDLALDIYGDINHLSGRELIDFLHPPNYNYYGSDATQPVGASKSCWDLTTLEVYALYGNYNDPWAYHQL
ncbi:MAG: C45 family autoproteolytic acyltransferase/hydrolase [Promethearchaeota archaeon]